MGGHAVAVVGYGFMDDKYYWLIQNSWGPNACDNGFMKIEFGQIGIEYVTFAEPYIEEEGKTPVEIKLSYNKIDDECNIQLSLQQIELNNWKNTLEIIFESEDTKSNFNFQCGVLTFKDINQKVSCYFENLNLCLIMRYN